MTTKAAKLAIFIFSTLKMYWTLGNSEGPVPGPVPNFGPVLILGPWDRSGPDQLQTLLLEQPWEVPVNGILEYMKVVLAAVLAVSEIIVVGCGGVIVHSGDGERL